MMATTDERRFREIEQIHNDVFVAMRNADTNGGLTTYVIKRLARAQELLDAIRVRGNAAREKRATTEETTP